MNLFASELKEDLCALKELSVKLSEQFSSRDDLVWILQEVMEEDEIIFIEGFHPSLNIGDPSEYLFDFLIYKIPSDETRVGFDNGVISLDHVAAAADDEDIFDALKNNIFEWEESDRKNMSFLIIDILFNHSKIMESCVSYERIIISKNDLKTTKYNPH